MSLNNIQLGPELLTSLYPNVLIETAASPNKTEGIKYLGNNKKHILVLVQNEQTAFLEDNELNFLSSVLSACKLSLADVAIINLNALQDRNYKALINELKSKSVLLFGVEPDTIDLPFKFPFFQLQQFDVCTYLSAPPLKQIEADKALKSKLWNCLKSLFGL